MPAVDLIIPARNEAENLPALFEALPRDRFRRVIVADNGSTDATAALARERGAVVVHEPTPGYGGACLAALRWIEEEEEGARSEERGEGRPTDGSPPRALLHAPHAPPTAVAFLDADLSDDPACLPQLIDAVTTGDAELAIGSRVRLAEPGALEPHQRFGNALACRLIALATGRRFADLGPMRAIRWDSLQRLDMRDRTWGWMVEMNFKAAARRLAVVELDVPYRRRRAGTSKISGSIKGSIKAGTKIIATIFALWRSERNAAAQEAGETGRKVGDRDA